MKKEKRYCDVDHANTQLDRLRKKPSRVSKRLAAQREAAEATPPGAEDPAAKTG